MLTSFAVHAPRFVPYDVGRKKEIMESKIEGGGIVKYAANQITANNKILR
jgi:hypothetical protein